MRLAARVERLRSMYWAAVFGVMALVIVVGGGLGIPWGLVYVFALAAAFVFTLGWPRLRRARERRIVAAHWRAVAAAYDEEDPAVLDDRYGELEEYFRLWPADNVSALEMRAASASLRERWAEARAILRQIDRDRLHARGRLWYDNSLAWCLAHDGAAADAVTLARANVSRGDEIEADSRSYLHGTLGVALLMAGDATAAVTSLRTAIDVGGPRWAQALRHYYLGEALWALARFAEACAAWEAVCALTPRGRWAQRARQKLATPAPAAYR